MNASSARAAAVLLACCAAACSNPEDDRLKRSMQPAYDESTGRLKQLTHDRNRNGRADTWTDMDGRRPVRSRIDRNEDGRTDRWEYYDDRGRLAKVGYSRRDDGKADAWAFPGPDGKVARIEISSVGDERRIDRWERYDPADQHGDGNGTLIAVDEDTDSDGRADKWETYEKGALATAAFDENRDGSPDRKLTYEAGRLVLIESAPDSSGRFTRQARVK